MSIDLADLLNRRFMAGGGRSTVVAARLDQRCSYCLYSPEDLTQNPNLRNILVYVHGHGRRFQYLLNSLRTLAKTCQCLLLCPLFPGNIVRDGNLDGYKYLREPGINYDEVLIDMVSEVREAVPIAESRFLLGGFSGGAQFAHRFCYFYPDMVKAASVAAPGSVTLLDDTVPWWPGILDAADFLGRDIDLEGLKTVHMQLVVGAADASIEEAKSGVANRYWVPEAEIAGANRVQRLQTLQKSLIAHGISVQLDVVPGAGHNFASLLPAIEVFFRQRALPDPGG